MAEYDVITCPACSWQDFEQCFPAATRNGKLPDGRGVCDVGWRCPKCGQEFGFEVLARKAKEP